MSVAGPLELECKGWLCCWRGCVGTDCDSAAAFGEAVASSCSGEECDAQWGSGKLYCRTSKQQGSSVSLQMVAKLSC